MPPESASARRRGRIGLVILENASTLFFRCGGSYTGGSNTHVWNAVSQHPRDQMLDGNGRNPVDLRSLVEADMRPACIVGPCGACRCCRRMRGQDLFALSLQGISRLHAARIESARRSAPDLRRLRSLGGQPPAGLLAQRRLIAGEGRRPRVVAVDPVGIRRRPCPSCSGARSVAPARSVPFASPRRSRARRPRPSRSTPARQRDRIAASSIAIAAPCAM